MGRDEQFKAGQRQREMQTFASAVAQGHAVVLDRFGQPIKINDLVLHRLPIDPVFRVRDIKPVLDPRAPTGIVTLVLEVVLPIQVMIGQPLQSFVTVGVFQPEGQPAESTDPLPQGAPVDPPSGPSLVRLTDGPGSLPDATGHSSAEASLDPLTELLADDADTHAAPV